MNQPGSGLTAICDEIVGVEKKSGFSDFGRDWLKFEKIIKKPVILRKTEHRIIGTHSFGVG